MLALTCWKEFEVMTQLEIIEEINKLTSIEQLEVIKTVLQTVQTESEQTKNLLKREVLRQQLEVSAQLMLNDYLNDEELTIFTALDGEDFYE